MKMTKAIALSLAALIAAGAIAGCGDQKKEAKAPADKVASEKEKQAAYEKQYQVIVDRLAVLNK